MAFYVTFSSLKKQVCVWFSFKTIEHLAKLNWWWNQPVGFYYYYFFFLLFYHQWHYGATTAWHNFDEKVAVWFVFGTLLALSWGHGGTQACKWYDTLLRVDEGDHANVLCMQLFHWSTIGSSNMPKTYQLTRKKTLGKRSLPADVNMV